MRSLAALPIKTNTNKSPSPHSPSKHHHTMTTRTSATDKSSFNSTPFRQSDQSRPIRSGPTSLHDKRLAREADGKIWANVENLIEKAFPSPDAAVVAKVKAQLYDTSSSKWSTFPKSPTEAAVADWLCGLEAAFTRAQQNPTSSRLVRYGCLQPSK